MTESYWSGAQCGEGRGWRGWDDRSDKLMISNIISLYCSQTNYWDLITSPVRWPSCYRKFEIPNYSEPALGQTRTDQDSSRPSFLLVSSELTRPVSYIKYKWYKCWLMDQEPPGPAHSANQPASQPVFLQLQPPSTICWMMWLSCWHTFSFLTAQFGMSGESTNCPASGYCYPHAG